MSLQSLKKTFEKKKVSLIGAGVSNVPLIPFLKNLGAEVTLREKKDETSLGEKASLIRSSGAELICGEGYLDGLCEDIIIRSPGIRPDIPEFEKAKENGSLIKCEIELFAEHAPCPVFAVTGSDGKSTTTTILSKILCPKGKVYLGGNIGEPLLQKIPEMTEDDACAVEMSSFQLMTMDAPFHSAVITNISPNHLNWHTGMDEYILAKTNILKRAENIILNLDCPETKRIGDALIKEGKKNVIWFSLSEQEDTFGGKAAVFLSDCGNVTVLKDGLREAVLERSDIVLPGLHNTANYMAAFAAAYDYTSPRKLKEVASSFAGVKHRLQLVADFGGVKYYNSSIDSSPSRTAAAVSALESTAQDRKITIICGGYDKNIPFAPLAETLKNSPCIKNIVLTGATKDKISSALKESGIYEKRPDITVKMTDCFLSAAETASSLALPGETVLLSPACASFDEFENFEKRGERFAEIVLGLKEAEEGK